MNQVLMMKTSKINHCYLTSIFQWSIIILLIQMSKWDWYGQEETNGKLNSQDIKT